MFFFHLFISIYKFLSDSPAYTLDKNLQFSLLQQELLTLTHFPQKKAQ